MKRVLIILVLAVVGGLLYRGAHRADPEPDFYSGVVEATEVRLAFQQGGTLLSVGPEEGDTVQAGQVVATLDLADLEAELAAARAEAATARAQLEELEAGSRPQEIAQARAQLEQARAELAQLQNGATAEQLAQARHAAEAARQQWLLTDRGYREEDIRQARAELAAARSDRATARADWERYSTLYKEGAAPESLYEEKTNRYRQAQARAKVAAEHLEKLEAGFRAEEKAASRQQYLSAQARSKELQEGTRPEVLEQARARVEGLEARLDLVEEGPRSQQVEAARGRLEAAEARLQAVQVRLDRATLEAPIEGIVTLRNLEPGENVAPGVPVLTVANLAEPWVTIFIPEPELGTVNLGDAATVTIDSGQSLPGRIRFIASQAEYTPRQIQTEQQRVLLVFRAEVAVGNPELVLKPGMPADVKVLK